MRRIISLGVGLLVIFGVVGCAGSSQELITPDFNQGTTNDGIDTGGSFEEGGADGNDTGDREVIKTAVADISSNDPAKSASELGKLVNFYLGRVDQKNLYTDIDGVSIRATLVLRIPAEKLDNVLDTLGDFGAVQLLEVGSTDITVSVRDIEARVIALETSVTRLLDLLNSATSTSDLIEIEYALTQRQSELDGLKSTLNYYQDAVSYATLTVNIFTEDQAPENPPDNFWEGLVAGWQGLVGFLSGLVVASGLVIPWLIFIGIPLGILIWWLIRRNKATKKSKKTTNKK
jgi:hypothetical protein